MSPYIFRSQQTTSSSTVEEIFSAIEQYLDENLLNNLRKYVTMAKYLPYSISEAVQKRVQEDFVEMRQDVAAKVSSDDLHAWLTLGRLMSLSLGETELSLTVWDKVKQMEKERTGRQQPQQQQ